MNQEETNKPDHFCTLYADIDQYLSDTVKPFDEKLGEKSMRV